MPTKKRNLAIHTLYDPVSEDKHATKIDLVLVHGLNGDPFETWKDQDSGVFWPQELLPAELPGARVMSFGYNADIHNNTSVAGIRGNAKNLLHILQQKREKIGSTNPIVFLAHSLGGLIVKQAMVFANWEKNFRSIASATRGLMFFGTPHAGSDESQWQAIAKSFAPLAPGSRLKSVFTDPPIVKSLASNSNDITEICEDFTAISRYYAIASFYENHKWPGSSRPIVEKMSAKMGLDHEQVVGLEADHVNMCSFESEEDSGFALTVAQIKRVALGMPIAEPEREKTKSGKGVNGGGNINITSIYVDAAAMGGRGTYPRNAKAQDMGEKDYPRIISDRARLMGAQAADNRWDVPWTRKTQESFVSCREMES